MLQAFHRLNRTEYQNTIRDLLALDINAESLLPHDESGHGFDNVNVGDLSPTLLDRYLTAADGHRNLMMTMAMDLSAKRGVALRLPLDLDEFNA